MIKVINGNLKAFSNILYTDSPSYSGIVSGESKGEVWVDRLENPTLALVYSFPVGGFSIMGAPNELSVYEDFITFLREDLFLDLKTKGFNDFEFSIEDSRTVPYIMQLFTKESISQEEEYHYRMSESSALQELDAYCIHSLDSDFINRLQEGFYDNSEFVDEKILESWESYEIFMDRSLAFVATFERTIVGVIVGTARYEDTIPIDIEIAAKHRNKGVATALTRYFVNGCVHRRLTAQWDCMASNIASRNTAEKAGFKRFKKQLVYWFSI